MSKTRQDKSEVSSYNPYLHGTTSFAVSMMPKTNFQLMPILRMIADYKTAPMAGEFSKGGYSILGNDLLQKEQLVGAISFGRSNEAYSLERIIGTNSSFTGYTSHKHLTQDELQQRFDFEVKRGFSTGFSNFNLILIYLIQARQLKIPLEQLIKKETLKTLQNQLNTVVQFYYFVQLLNTYIHPNYNIKKILKEHSPLLEEEGISHIVMNLLNFKNICEKINTNNIDMKEIYNHPTPENLNRALSVLEVPKKVTVPLKTATVEFTLPITQFFELNKTPRTKTGKFAMEWDRDLNFELLFQNTGHDIGFILRNYLLEKTEAKSDPLSARVKQHISVLEDRIRAFNDILNASDKQFELPTDDHSLLKDDYPIIFVTESEHIKPHGGEHRCSTPLKLGNDIPSIATDTKKHREQLKEYFRKHHIPMRVILISDLQKNLTDKVAPHSINTKYLRAMLEQTKNLDKKTLFYDLYELLEELNHKRNTFHDTNSKAFVALNSLLNNIDNEMNIAFGEGKEITAASMNVFCTKSSEYIQEQRTLLETHRGIMGVLDSLLTVLASLILFYPIVYAYQKNNNIGYTFFNTDSGQKAKDTLAALSEIKNEFPSK